MQKHPRMMYRPGARLEWAGKTLDTRIVADEAEEADAAAQGWRTAADILAGDPAPKEPHPLDHDGDGQKGGSLPGEQSTRRRRRPRKVAG